MAGGDFNGRGVFGAVEMVPVLIGGLYFGFILRLLLTDSKIASS